MKLKMLILSLLLILLSISNSFSNEDCLDCNLLSRPPITYSVVQPSCGVCFYKVYYSICDIEGYIQFRIDSVEAASANPTCCQATAINDPIVSGYIIQEAAEAINPGGGAYTPSRCWKWKGTLGPGGIHNAVFVPCDYDESCCYFTGGSWLHWGPETCDLLDACMQICD